MLITPKLPEKVQFVANFSSPLVKKLLKKTKEEAFLGGRKGYDKEVLFTWLLTKKLTNWNYRTIASMAGVSHPTLIRANNLFLKRKVYETVMVDMVKKAYRKGLIKGKFVALDSSFAHTFSKRGELGAKGWNEFKKGYSFKLHLLIDTETKFPLSLCITNELAADNTLVVKLLRKTRPYLKQCGYVLADKGYDDGELSYLDQSNTLS